MPSPATESPEAEELNLGVKVGIIFLALFCIIGLVFSVYKVGEVVHGFVGLSQRVEALERQGAYKCVVTKSHSGDVLNVDCK